MRSGRPAEKIEAALQDIGGSVLIDHRRAYDVRSRGDVDSEAARIRHRELVAVQGDVDPAAATASTFRSA